MHRVTVAMPPDSLSNHWQRAGLATAVPQHWRHPLARCALAWAAILLLTARDWFAMAGQWWDSSTYNHILFVPLIIGWLVWVRREELAKLQPQAWWPGLVLVAGALFVWLLGSVSGVNLVSQAGAVLALQAAIPAVLGPRVAAGLLFPLAYMAFLVPFGDELVPTLQMVTAKLVILLIGLSGIPAHIDGVFIDTPVGLFEVAEACSGVKFLVAMVALGTLVAHCCFTGWKKRTAFMTVAIALPILANGVRAWGTIYIAQSQGIEFAEGFDHIFYGWVFFALVIAVLLGLSWRHFDRSPEDPGVDAGRVLSSPLLDRLSQYSLGANAVLGGMAALIMGFASWAALAASIAAPVPQQVDLLPVEGWARVDYGPTHHWEPRASGADHRLLGRYRDAAGREVDVFLAIYSAQEEGREAGAFGQGALDFASEWRWLEDAPGSAEVHAEYLLAEGRIKRRAETSFLRGELLTGSVSRLRLATMQDKLLLQSRPTMMLILSSEESDGQKPADSIAAFRTAIGPEREWMDRIAGLR